MTASLAAGVWLGVPAAWLAAVAGLSLLSLADDIRHLPFWLRLSFHLGTAIMLCFLLDLPAWLWPPAMLTMGWMTNLYNFMDGADGLAGSQGAVGFIAYAAGFLMAGDEVLAAWCMSISAACIGFLRFNWPPARIFMGDVGSIPLGFLAGGLGLQGVWHGAWPGWFPLLAFAPFILDATVTLVRRGIAGKRVWEAHREHYYQRMVIMGYGHKGMTIRWLATMLACAVSSVALLWAEPAVVVTGMLAWAAVFVAVAAKIDLRWQAFETGGLL